MTRFYRSVSALTVSACFMGSGAYADVTVTDVWDMWKSYMASYGYEVTAQEAQSGDSLTLTDIKATFAVPEGMGTASSTISEFTLKQNGDGTVSVMCPEVLTVNSNSEIKVPVDDTQDIEEAPQSQAPKSEDQGEKDKTYITHIGMQIHCADIEMIASGTPAEMKFDYTGPNMAIKLLEFDTPSHDADIDQLEVMISGIEGHDTYKIDDVVSGERSFAAETLDYSMEMSTPGKGDSLTLSSAFKEVSFQGAGEYPAGADMSVMAGLGQATMDGTFRYASETTEFKSSDSMSGTSKSSSGSGRFAVKDGVSKFALSSNDMTIALTAGVPLPVEIGVKGMGMNWTMPFVPGDESKDFGIGLTFKEVSVPELLWGFVDPQEKLSHEPITLAFDLGGKGKLKADFTNIEEMAKVDSGDQEIGELDALSLKSLTVKAMGAELTGDGELSFDNSNSDKKGIPDPTGEVDLTLNGSSALIDNLIAAGLLPEEKAMGVRMMLGMFTVAGDGEDARTSKIEFRPGGEILANGQRIK